VNVPWAGIGEGVGVGANVGLGLAVGPRLDEGDAGPPPHPATARIRTSPANARPVEPLPLSIPELALTLRLHPPSEPLQDGTSRQRA
jgi:hypothetical protein